MHYPVKFMSLSSSVVMLFSFQYFHIQNYLCTCVSSKSLTGGGIRKRLTLYLYKGQEAEQHTATQKHGIQRGSLKFKVTNKYTSVVLSNSNDSLTSIKISWENTLKLLVVISSPPAKQIGKSNYTKDSRICRTIV